MNAKENQAPDKPRQLTEEDIRRAVRREFERKEEIEREEMQKLGRDLGNFLTGWMPW